MLASHSVRSGIGGELSGVGVAVGVGVLSGVGVEVGVLVGVGVGFFLEALLFLTRRHRADLSVEEVTRDPFEGRL
jgi:hypothetical protein